MNFADMYVPHRTRKGNFRKHIDALIDWSAINQEILKHDKPISDVVGRPAYPGLLPFKMLLIGIWNGGLSDEAVEDMANSNLHAIRFLGLSLADDVPDHSVLSRFRPKLTKAKAWDKLLSRINQQIHSSGITLSTGCHVDASITHRPRKPKSKTTYEVVEDREERDDEPEAQKAMRVVEV